MTGCTASARLTINGNLRSLRREEDVGTRVIKQFFPTNADGDMWKGGRGAGDEQATRPNWRSQDRSGTRRIWRR